MSKTFEESGTGPGGFGERLRRERETRGISLDEIAAVTKIGTRLLRALENEQFDLLPGGIFNKGYVRAYARHLGIDEEQAVADYLKAAHETPPDVRQLVAHASSIHDDADSRTSGAFARWSLPFVPILILVVLIAGAVGGWRLYRQRQRERAEAVQTLASGRVSGANGSGGPAQDRPATTSTGEKAGARQQAPNASTSSAIHTVEAAESSSRPSASPEQSVHNAGAAATAPFVVTVRARDRARVEVKSDGEVVVRGVIEPSEVRTFHATNRLIFWTANAGQVEVSFNGKSVPLTGGENDERVLVFNARGLAPRTAQ